MSSSSCSKPPAEAGQRVPRRPERLVALGRISAVWGIRGWLKIRSHAREAQSILSYSPWFVGVSAERVETYRVVDHRLPGGILAVAFQGLTDRDAAAQLVGRNIYVRAAQLPTLAADEYYWFELQGLRVVTRAGIDLGVVDHLLETGANDVLVIEGERQHLVPYVDRVVRSVDLDAGRIEVDWETDY